MAISTEILQATLKNYLESHIPSKKHIRIDSLVKITDGWETDVYSFRSEYESNRKHFFNDMILRMYPGDESEGKATKEFNAIAQLLKAGYPVPKVYYLETNRSILGKPFMIMEKINGQSLGVVLEKKLETRETLFRLFCKMFVNLHRLDLTPFITNRELFSDFSSYDVNDPFYYLNKLFAEWRSTVAMITDEYALDYFNKIMDWLDKNKQAVPYKKPSLVHLDYHPYNILIRNDGKPFVIDWTNFNIADYRVDLAWTVLLMSTYGNPTMREQVLETYEKFAGSKVENIEYFEVIAATRRIGSIYLSLTQGAEKLGMLPETVETMKRQTDHINNIIKVINEITGIAPKFEI